VLGDSTPARWAKGDQVPSPTFFVFGGKMTLSELLFRAQDSQKEEDWKRFWAEMKSVCGYDVENANIDSIFATQENNAKGGRCYLCGKELSGLEEIVESHLFSHVSPACCEEHASFDIVWYCFLEGK
jgi:hypothetical protein